MNSLNHKIMLLVGVLMLFGQQTVMADNRPPSHRNEQVKRAYNAPSHKSQVGHRGVPAKQIHNAPSRKAQFGQHFDSRRNRPAPSYQHYYKPSYRVNQLPHRHSRIVVNAAEYFFFDGFFYRPSRGGYVIVDAPIGAIIATLPRLHHLVHWRGQPYYIVDNTFYRRHPRGYIVVPDPGYGYRR